MATKYFPPQATPSTVASFESSGAPRKYSSMSAGASSIQGMHSNNSHYSQTASSPVTPIHNHYKSYSCPTTPVGTTTTPYSNSNHPFFPSSPTTPRNGHATGISLSLRTTTLDAASKENHYFAANHPNLLQPRQPQNQKQTNTQNQWKNNNDQKNQHPLEAPLSPVSPSKVAFAKSQADLNRAYWQRRAKFLQMPIAARFETGRNLKHFQPLAIRTAEFC